MKRLLIIILLGITVQVHAQLRENAGFWIGSEELERQIDIAINKGIALDSPRMCRLIYDFKEMVKLKEQSIHFDNPGSTLRFCYEENNEFIVDQYFYRIIDHTLEVGNEANNTWEKWGVFTEDFGMLILITGKVYSLQQGDIGKTQWGKYE